MKFRDPSTVLSSHPRRSLLGPYAVVLGVLMTIWTARLSFFSGALEASLGEKATLLSSAGELLESWNFSGDRTKYLQFAIFISDWINTLGAPSAELVWSPLHPPGQSLIEAFLVGFSSLFNTSFVLVYLIFSDLVWAIIFGLYFGLLKARTRSTGVALMFTVTPLLFGDLLKSIVAAGFFLSDLNSIALILLALFQLIKLLIEEEKSPYRRLIFLGIIIGALAHLRANFFFFPLILLILLFSWIAIVSTTAWVRKVPTLPLPARPLSGRLWLAAVALVSAAMSVPWLIIRNRLRPQDGIVWTSTSDYFSFYRWMPDTLLPKKWMLEGRINVGCKIDPLKCEEFLALESSTEAPYSGLGLSRAEMNRALYDSILNHPTEFFVEFLTKIVNGLVWSIDSASPSSTSVLVAVSTVAIWAATPVALHWARTPRPEFPIFLAAILVTVSAPIALISVEARYLLPLEVVASFLPAQVLVIRLAASRAGPRKNY